MPKRKKTTKKNEKVKKQVKGKKIKQAKKTKTTKKSKKKPVKALKEKLETVHYQNRAMTNEEFKALKSFEKIIGQEIPARLSKKNN